MTIVPDPVGAYAERHTSPPPDHLAHLAEETRRSLPVPEMLSGPVEGRFLQMLVWVMQPRLVLEIGTYSGSAAQFMAAALPAGGRVVTCEVAEEIADFAEARFRAGPHGDRIELRRGPALETIASVEGPYDLVFVDADKEGYVDYYEAVLPRLSERGLIAVDNTLRRGTVLDPQDDVARAIDRFNRHVADDPRTVQVLLTVRDGVTLIRRNPACASSTSATSS